LADFIVRNSLNPYKSVRFSITLQQQVLKGSEAEPIWTAEINTLEPAATGDKLKSKFIHLRTLENLDKEIEKAVSELCDQIDWSPLLSDRRAPYVHSCSPAAGSSVDIDSSIELIIKESLPAAGIDVDSISVTFDDMDITDEITIKGDPYEYTVKWKPSTIIYETH
jgi:hypothetical protein